MVLHQLIESLYMDLPDNPIFSFEQIIMNFFICLWKVRSAIVDPMVSYALQWLLLVFYLGRRSSLLPGVVFLSVSVYF